MKLRVRSHWRGAGTALSIAVVSLTMSGSSHAQATNPLKVGLLIQLSGAAGVYGAPSQQAAELAVDEISKTPAIR
jgi:ABC-type branched-subunit amino acid transport system substrate-binding protein